MIAEHLHVGTDVLPAHAAELASATGENGRDEYSLADLQMVDINARFLDDSRCFMTEDDRWGLEGRNAMFDVVQIGVTCSTSCDPDKNLIRPHIGNRDIFDSNALIGTVEYCCFHRFNLFRCGPSRRNGPVSL